ncbi:unnamed protein product [Penicillium bialowiezense]
MAPYPHLTSGLRHVPTLRPLKEGEIFIIRYKNALRGYTTDVWIGVILPHMFGPTRHTHRRPSGAQPEDGEWGTHLKDRVYSFYLPGRNMYRWAGINDIFLLEEVPINIMERNGRHGESQVWKSLLEIIKSKPDTMFWQDMSLHEIGTKGKRGRQVRIVMPHEDEDEDGSPEDEEEEESEVESISIAQKRANAQDTTTGPRKVQATSRSLSDSRNGSLESNDPSSSQINSNAGLALGVNEESNPNMKEEDEKSNVKIHQRARTSSLAHRQHRQHREPQTPKPEPSIKRELFACLYSSLSDTPSSRNKMSVPGKIDEVIHSRIDRHRPTATDRPDGSFPARYEMILRHVMETMPVSEQEVKCYEDLFKLQNKPAMSDLRTWSEQGVFRPFYFVQKQSLIEYDIPRPLQMKESNGETTMRVLGDRLAIGQATRLVNFHDPQVLHQGIRSLAVLYGYAKSYANSIPEMNELCMEIAKKLQISWNCYEGLSQCSYLLEVAEVAFPLEYSIADSLDEVQAWFIKFLAETYQLFNHGCPAEFGVFLRHRRVLHGEILNIQNEIRRRQPELFEDIRPLLRSRGIFGL